MSLTLSVGDDSDVAEAELSALSVSSSAFASPAGPTPTASPAPPLVRKSSFDSRPGASPTKPVRPRGLSRSHTLPRVPQLETKSRRKNSELDALVVEPDVLARIRRWILGVAIVDFDVDDGPVITGIYPSLVVFPAEAENIAFSAFPDSPQFEDGSQDHSFRIREHPMSLPSDRRSAPKDGFMYGFAHFTQRKDSTSKRGYEQRSLVILTHHAYPALFARISALLGPLFQEHGLPMLEAACHNIATWSDPTPGMIAELGFLGTVLSVELPHSPEQQQLVSKAYDPRQHILASSSTFTPPPLLLFEAALSHLWSLWECLVLCEPLLIFGASPAQTSQAIWWLRDLLRPLPLTGDMRPYFTIHDTDHATLASHLPPAAGRVLGVTNPVFERSCAHWPHVLSLGRRVPLNTATHGASAGNTRARAGPLPGWKTRTHTRYVSKDRALLRRLEDACASNSERERLDASLDLRRHFHARTTEMLVPLARYLHTLIPTPAERAASASPEALRMRAFSAPAFLASLKTGAGAALPFRSTARRKEFYERWLRTPAFGVWLGLQERIVHGVLEGG
ncbi:hypothetical protein DFH07DRAFT_1021874 [Mycena maculata]|uniref:UDENN domain-containing protein n=1 Tax=Mycena maculata TaxID=230809 RepID=A0AAD7NH17_9AGAR|nr:hypothetical protein DFH07DRAFT_1021874 [Mycena maculata]